MSPSLAIQLAPTLTMAVAGASPVLQLLLQQWPVILAILLVPLSFLLLRGRSRSGLKLPPGPMRLPFVGNLHQIGRLPHRSLAALARRHGPVMMLRLGMVPTVVLTSPEAAREALKTKDEDCSSRPLSAGPGLLSYGYKDVAFSPWSDYVREMRKLFIIELLSRRRVQAAYYARDAQIDKLVETLTVLGPNPVHLDALIFATMDRIVGLFAFGESYAGEQFKGQFVPLLNATMDMLGSFSAQDFFPNAVGRIIDRITGVKAHRERVFRQLDRFFEHIIEQCDGRKATGGSGSDLVQELLDIMKRPAASAAGTFTRDHVKAILMNTFIGSIDTTTVTITWAMAELIRNPRVLTRVQLEIRAAAGGGTRVHQADMPKMSYLRMVLSETLRLHPPATLLVPRETLRRVQVAGYDIPAKTQVIVNAWAISRDPSAWKDPEEFNPERFQDTDVDFNGSHFEFIPFGAGRRICPGLAMGVANAEYILANLLYCFNWALPNGVSREGVNMEEEGGLTYRKKTPLMLVPTRYHPAQEKEEE
ncbi:4-hydroxyphenylacetaldehyde oxime monooxygenase-like [Aegilops tauschii subsp. strangulata]|nr:4-hydroxyphenylacetaldehyde oxime monooxygenase-like [Aegilops tauschii subsp. strangulata]